MTILALIPIRHDMPHALVDRASILIELLQDYEESTGRHRVEAYIQTCRGQGDGRPYSAHAEARNAMLDLFLKPSHTHILWMDADVVEYPPDLASQLLARDSAGIIAATPLIEGSNRFYDVYGFVLPDGSRIEKPYPPYPDGPMLCVGTCYLANADIYHDGARYAPTEGHTEHMSVCKKASRVSVAADVIIRHADLPKWGEEWHTL